METVSLNNAIFKYTENIGTALRMADRRDNRYAQQAAIQTAQQELTRLKALLVPSEHRRLMVMATELLENAIATVTQSPNTSSAEFLLGQNLAWAVAENRSYLEVGKALFASLGEMILRDPARMSEVEHATRNTYVFAATTWLMSAHRSLERPAVEALPTFPRTYAFLQGRPTY